MAGFLYFRSGEQTSPTLDTLTKWGLGYAFEAGPDCRVVMGATPSGAAGSIFADPARQSRSVKLDMAGQTWRKLPSVVGRPDLYLGYWSDSPPQPRDLARPAMLRGVPMTLGDGNEWQIPIVRRWDGQAYESVLPAYVDFDENGLPIRGNPVAKYARLWEVTTPVADAHLGGDVELTDKQVIDGAVALLQANYVVDLPELATLQVLVDDDQLALISLAANRFDQLKALLESESSDQKKSEQLATTGAGNAA